VAELSGHTVWMPMTVSGGEGTASNDTSRLEAGDAPQTFLAATAMVPPSVLAIALREVVVEFPAHPGGSVQV
jgi:hypothetical protein